MKINKNELVVKHMEEDKLQDSLSIGSSAKDCEIKVYVDFSKPEEAKKKIDEAVKQREYLLSKVRVE